MKLYKRKKLTNKQIQQTESTLVRRISVPTTLN